MNEVRARVISQERELYRVESEEQELWAEVSGKFRHDAQTVSDFPAVGDYVTVSWPEDGSHGIISAIFPRKSCFIRKAAGKDHREQVVAANVDFIFLCMSLNEDFNLRRIERYLALAWESGAAPVIVLTKADICPDVEHKINQVHSVAIGVDVITVSSYMNDFEGVKEFVVPGKTVAFLGSSGVGKSTLINKLIGEDRIETQEIREDGKGRHTTTRREVIRLQNGAYVMDTPGMRELGMWDNDGGLETVFSDIEQLMTRCRFSNCRHQGEPGCAVSAALESGELERRRWESFRKLKTENDFAADSSSYLQAKEEKFRQISKINKHRKKKKF